MSRPAVTAALSLGLLLAGTGCGGGPEPRPNVEATEVPRALRTPVPGLIGPPAVAAPESPAAAADAADVSPRWAVDRSAPIHVRADSIALDQKRGVTVYQGKVSFEQGLLRINADRIEARLKGERLDSVQARGRPLRFRHAGTGETQEVRGSAARLEYRAASGRLSLFGDVRVQQGRNEFRSQVMHYDLSAETLDADGGDAGQVSVTIEPAALGAEDAAGRLKKRDPERP